MADASSVSSQVLTTLGVGSGLDVFKLAQGLDRCGKSAQARGHPK